MSQAVKNVQLSARQKLMMVYEEKLVKAAEETNQNWSKCFERLDELIDQKLPSEVFDELVRAGHHSVIVYNRAGDRFYPLVSADLSVPVDPAEQFRDAWRLEFAEQKLTEAIELYEEKTQSNNTYVRLKALIGKARCLAKLGNQEQAIETYEKVALSFEEKTCGSATLMLIANARLLLMELTKSNLQESESDYSVQQHLLREPLSKLLAIIGKQNEAGAVLPLDQSLFLTHKISESLEQGLNDVFIISSWHEGGQSAVSILANGGLTVAMIERFPNVAALEDWPKDQFRQLRLDEKTICYGVRHDSGDKTVLLLKPSRLHVPLGFRYQYNFLRTGIAYRILDNSGLVVAGLEHPRGKPFLKSPVGGYFAGWQAELYFKGDDDIFERTARRQIAIYVWAGVLVIGLILAAGGFAGQVVVRQIKLNKLKNDFIATVSHELKTPLASMRVLVDTLLEGNYKDQKQASEYLQLTSTENERLSRLIDNFLTFSRMERNKQVFRMVRSSPAAIARAATEVVKTKFNKGRCRFEINICEDLPDVLADRDAMVTVLVNLLDNAYKYSYDDKQIELRVFTEDGQVYFCVSDNGTGMSRRSAKKIFKRFYQVDRSLSRHGQGCGLGLSIAKFIVDAHKGSISVDSKPGEGSTFTVKLPHLLSCPSPRLAPVLSAKAETGAGAGENKKGGN
jgi:signal transduction histidine kinase